MRLSPGVHNPRASKWVQPKPGSHAFKGKATVRYVALSPQKDWKK